MNRFNKFDHAPCHAYFDNFGNLIISDATIIYPNLLGKDGEGNILQTPEERDKTRSFKVFIDDENFAKQLNEDGFSISMDKPDPETGAVHYFLKCKVSYRYFEPKIIMHIGNKAFAKDINDVEYIDTEDVLNSSVDLILRPSKYSTKMGKEGFSVYVKEMHYSVEPNPFADKYASTLDAGEAPEDE